MRRVHLGVVRAGLLAGLTALVGCPGAPTGVDGPGGVGGPGGESKVDPNTCGSYAASESGSKIKAFLEATVALDEAVRDTENYAKETCVMMGKELGMSPTGSTQEVCSAVSEELKAHLQAGVKAEASLDVGYQPAVCEVNADVAAQAAASCEGKAEGEVSVTCEGTCSGTCNGTCEGECAGGAEAGGGGGEAGGKCAGECKGTCKGECTGSCEGSADVDASAECEASAEVEANVQAECTPPEVTVEYDAAIVADSAKLEAAVAAIKTGLPRLLVVHAMLTGPVKSAYTTWSATAEDLSNNAMEVAGSLGDQATCVAGQLNAAFGMLGQIAGSMEVSVSVSVEVSGSAGASI